MRVSMVRFPTRMPGASTRIDPLAGWLSPPVLPKSLVVCGDVTHFCLGTMTKVGTMTPENSSDQPLQAQSIGVSLTVGDLSKSVRWYRDVVGFTVDREYERDGNVFAVALKAGSVRILLTQDDGAKGLHRSKGEGFSMQITTTDDVDAIATRFTASPDSVVSAPADTPWGARALRVRDPDGFRLVISSPSRA